MVNVVNPAPPETKVTLVGLRDAVRPVGDADDTRVTVPANPFTLVRFILEFEVRPVTTLTLAGPVIEKSTIFTVIVIEWTRVPLVPCKTTL